VFAYVALPRIDFARIAFASAAAILAAAPLAWLIGTWRDPAFDSHGLVYFAVFAALTAWSATSRLIQPPSIGDQRIAIVLLAATALVRLAGQLLAIDTIGALALVIDVYALARLAGLHRRSRAVSPFWLAVAFAFALPLERIIQRSVGFVLQDISAQGACAVLSAVFADVRCAGVRITVEGADVLVDLPCSGARALIIFGFAFAVAAALARPPMLSAIAGGVLALAAACAGNVLRISILAAGVALGPEQLGVDVMAQPWHDLAGLVSLAGAFPVVIWWAQRVRPSPQAPAASAGRAANSAPRPPRSWAACAFLLAALVIIAAPSRPIDIAARDISIAPPERIGDLRGSPLPLAPRERAYFEQFGGAAAKASYGEFGLLLARTTSPLRHLHAPDECLRGLGYRVNYVGMRFAPVPSAHYRAIAPDGSAYRVEVSFLSDRGHRAASVSEAVWLWLADRSTVWTAVQRISPEQASPAAREAFDAGVFAALDQPRTPIHSP